MKEFLDEWCTDNNAELLEVEETHGQQVANDYFVGDPPFKAPGHKDDFPDAFIAQSAGSLAARLDETIHAVCADKRLGACLSEIEGVTNVYQSLSAISTCLVKKAATFFINLQ